MTKFYLFKVILCLFFLQLVGETLCSQPICEPNAATRYRTRNVFPNVVVETFNYTREGTTDYALDVYFPATAPTVKETGVANRPLVIWSHPGGFATGSKAADDGVLFCTTLARMGYVCFNLDYRQDLAGQILTVERAV